MTRQDLINELDPDEVIKAEVRKHPIGLIPIYGSGFLVVAVMFVLIFFKSQVSESLLGFVPENLVVLVLIAIAALAVVITAVGAHVYKSNILLITNENIVQRIRYSLFNDKVSRLNLANIEDVTFYQRGILPRVLDYGVLHIETAGEKANFDFSKAPRPNHYAKMILQTSEEFMSDAFRRPGGNA